MARYGTLLRDWRILSCLTVLSFCIGYGMRLATHAAPRVYAQTGRSGFTATILTKQYDAQGNSYATFSTTFAKRPSGSTSTIREGFRNGQSSKHTSIRLVEEFKEVNAYNDSRSKSTIRLSPERVTLLVAHPDAQCTSAPGTFDPASNPQTLQGFAVVKKLSKEGGPDNKTAVTESWLAPELDCLVMKKTRELTDAHGTVIHREVAEVVQVEVGEPDPRLFALPDDFIERSPSEAYFAEAVRLGDKKCVKCQSSTLSNSDRLYYNQKF